MEEEKKGFKIVDRRGVEAEEPKKEEPKKPEAPQQRETGKEEGNRQRDESVKGEKSPGADPSISGPQFLDLVGMLQFGAMTHLGMIQTPDGKRSPVNLPAAKDSIDILSILQEKTKGNLTEEEKGVLTEGLYHLRMGYMSVLQSGQEKGGKGK
jgi:hypothetical protein